jgi:hypothetical protein
MKASQLILLILFQCCGCKDEGTAPPPITERMKLTLIDVAVKEAFVHVAVTNPASNETLSLQRNGTTVMTFTAVADTAIADTGLTQTTLYQYSARLSANNETTGTSNTITAQTLLPTSHIFTWRTFLLGDGNGSALYDVALMNDTLAYACGEIYLSGDPLPYNLAKWNGTGWGLHRVTVIFRGNQITPPLHGIFALSATDVWLAAGMAIHGDGTNWVGYDVRAITGYDTLSFVKCWGQNSSNVYFVGLAGSLARFASGTWQRLESGTTTHILDAWGVMNSVTGKAEVFCPVSSFFTPGDRRILRITDQTQVDSVPWSPGRLMSSLWTNRLYPLFTAGDGVFENSRGVWREAHTGASIYTNKIRGTALNDIVAVGDFGYITHYNGLGWQLVGYDYDAGYGSVAVKGTVVVAVGRKNAQGIVSIGRRQ